INAKDDNGFTPLHLIAFRGYSTVLGGLLAYLDQETLKEVINAKDKAANTPLHIAANEGHAELIDEFLAIFKNDPETLKALLNVKNKYQDMTPLDLATKNGHGDAVAALQIYEQQCLKDEASAQVQAIEKVMSNTTSEVNIDLLKQAMCSMEGKGIGQSTADTTMVDKNIHNLTIPLHDIDDGKRQCGNL
ncbi:ankyrin repeat domain-containing protein, partial [Candidatus Cardinium sp. cBcalN2]